MDCCRLLRDGQASADRWLDQQVRAGQVRAGQVRAGQVRAGRWRGSRPRRELPYNPAA